MKHSLHSALSWLAWQNRQGKKRPSNPTSALRLPVGGGNGQNGGLVPKAQGLKRRSRDPQPCNREGARGGWQTNRQTDRHYVHYSKMTLSIKQLNVTFKIYLSIRIANLILGEKVTSKLAFATQKNKKKLFKNCNKMWQIGNIEINYFLFHTQFCFSPC